MDEDFLRARENSQENGDGPTFRFKANEVHAERAGEEGNFGFEPLSRHTQTYC